MKVTYGGNIFLENNFQDDKKRPDKQPSLLLIDNVSYQ